MITFVLSVKQENFHFSFQLLTKLIWHHGKTAWIQTAFPFETNGSVSPSFALSSLRPHYRKGLLWLVYMVYPISWHYKASETCGKNRNLNFSQTPLPSIRIVWNVPTSTQRLVLKAIDTLLSCWFTKMFSDFIAIYLGSTWQWPNCSTASGSVWWSAFGLEFKTWIMVPMLLKRT